MASVVIDPSRPHLGGNLAGYDVATASPGVWEYLWLTYQPHTVFDVGCGYGQAMQWFRQRGCYALGLDGLECNAEAARHYGPVVVHDLTTGPIVPKGIDLVWCCEVVEHVEERFVDHVLDTICCGKVLAMTHALPGQSGHHHVNEQLPDYWISRVEARGFVLDRGIEVYRPMGGHWWQRSGLIFTRTAG